MLLTRFLLAAVFGAALAFGFDADLGLQTAMAMGLATAIRNSRLNVIRDAVDAGAGAGLFRVYDGSRPATGGTATTLLAELTFSDPSASNASSGVLTFNAITADASANATGTASWGRMVDSTGAFVGDFSVGTSAADFILNTVSITSGVQVSCSSATITEGNA